MGVEISGLDECFEKLDLLNETIFDAAAEGMNQAGWVIANQAKRNIHNVSGQLAQSIRPQTFAVPGEFITTIIAPHSDYAGYVEFGTGPKGEKNHQGISPNAHPTYKTTGWEYKDSQGRRHYSEGIRAHPFMYPAAKETEAQVRGKIASSIKAGLESMGG